MTVDPALIYRALEDQVCQGDIFENAPSLILKDKPKKDVPIQLAGLKAGSLTDQLSGATPAAATGEIVMPVFTLIGHAILLTYDCDLDKDKKHRTIALIRPMGSLNTQEQENVRSGGKYACFHLPALADVIPEGYVDLRRI